MRYDEKREVYRDCRWCEGRGCVSCQIEADKAYKAQFPDGPVPIATFDVEKGKNVLHALFGGDLMAEVDREARKRATEHFESLRFVAGTCFPTEAECIEALIPAKCGDVLTERVKQLDAEQHGIELTGIAQ